VCCISTHCLPPALFPCDENSCGKQNILVRCRHVRLGEQDEDSLCAVWRIRGKLQNSLLLLFLTFLVVRLQWAQTIGDVTIRFRVPEGTRGSRVEYVLSPFALKAGVKGQPPVLDGKLFAGVVPGESLWTLEDGVVEIVLQKQKKHHSWDSVLEGGPALDPLVKDQIDKKMMMEKFQREHPGFDFGNAEFTGQLPKDPASFGDNWKAK
jgi:hypothetical protein